MYNNKNLSMPVPEYIKPACLPDKYRHEFFVGQILEVVGRGLVEKNSDGK